MPNEEQHPPRTNEPEASGSGMPFLDHIEELRRRLIYSVLAVAVMAGVAFGFREQLLDLIIRPLGGVKLHFTEITGSFSAYLKVSLFAGVVAAAPFVLYQMWAFVSPGLYKREKSTVLPLVLVSTVLFVTGAAFCFVVVLPVGIKFLVDFGGDFLTPIITVDSYISFAGFMMLAFGLAFELPVLAYLLGRIGVIDARTLGRGRRYAVVAILLVAGIITPTPDIFSQVALAVPIYALYEVSILVVHQTGRKRDPD